MLPFTPTELLLAVADGRVTARSHSTLPYTIFNYSPEVQYSQQWDDVTLNCRGLILDDQFNIIARPWKKFFNLGQVNLPIQFDTPVEIMDKVDGSLGILYPEKSSFDSGHHTYAIATRGSFESTQALRATEIWREKYDGLHPVDGITMLFEIIIPENRIVLDYGKMEDLVLLGAVETASGHYLSPEVARWQFFTYQEGVLTDTPWPGPVVEVMPFNTLSDALGNMDRKNAEGFVIRSHNFLVKCKQPDYIELHRLVTNASPKTCWEQLKQGKSKAEIVSAFPDEFHEYVSGMIDPLVEAYQTRLDEITEKYWAIRKSCYDHYGHIYDRGQFARYIKNAPDKRYYFLLLDDRSIADVLWTELRPREETK